MHAKRKWKPAIGRWEFSPVPVGRMLFPSLQINPVINAPKKQLKNKLDVFKNEYTVFMEFKNCATGLGWEAEKRIVDCSDEWWQEHLAVRTKLSL